MYNPKALKHVALLKSGQALGCDYSGDLYIEPRLAVTDTRGRMHVAVSESRIQPTLAWKSPLQTVGFIPL